jgi:hypothetical protein
MALDALWTMLIPKVSGISQVQAPIHAGSRDTPAVFLRYLGYQAMIVAGRVLP